MQKLALSFYLITALAAAPAGGAVLDEITIPRKDPVFFNFAISPNGRDFIVPYRAGDRGSSDFLKCYVLVKSRGKVSEFYAGYHVDEARFYGKGAHTGNYLVKYCPYTNREKNFHWYIINGKVLGEFRNSRVVHNETGSSIAVAFDRNRLWGSSWHIIHDDKELGPFDEVAELAMSPDGKRVISISAENGRKNAVYVDGKELLKHGRGKFDTPHNLALSPDSKGYAFVHYDQGGSCVHYHDGAESRELGPWQSAYCLFMPPGKLVLHYHRNNHQYFEKYPDQKVYGPYERISRIPLLESGRIFAFAFEKDQREFVFLERDGRGEVLGPHANVEDIWLDRHNRYLYVIHEQGRHFVNIDGNVFGKKEGGYDFVYERVFAWRRSWRPVFSPDGTRFAIQYRMKGRSHINLDGSVIDLPAEALHMEFSPDSRKFLVRHPMSSGPDVLTVISGTGAAMERRTIGGERAIHAYTFTGDSRLLYALYDWRKNSVTLEEMDAK